jgi:hypothetical protein
VEEDEGARRLTGSLADDVDKWLEGHGPDVSHAAQSADRCACNQKALS